MHREPEVLEAEAQVGKWLDCRARITSKELHSVKKWHPPECLFYKSEKGCRFGEKCYYARRQVHEQPSKTVVTEKVMREADGPVRGAPRKPDG